MEDYKTVLFKLAKKEEEIKSCRASVIIVPNINFKLTIIGEAETR
jgi:hypothetical protein